MVGAALFLLVLTAIGLADIFAGAPSHAWYWQLLWIAYVIAAAAMLWARRDLRT